MKFSIIVPVYNASKYLQNCLEAIYKSKFKDYEVIVVDDASQDDVVEIVKRFPCILTKLEKNAGNGRARNIGASKATGEILVFTDPDVLLKEDSLELINESFVEDKQLVALTGLLSKEHSNNNFFSQYKNLYMNFIFSNMPKKVDFLYGSIMAIKKEFFPGFEEKMIRCNDTEMGQRLADMQGDILLNKRLEVIHMKKYTVASFFKNDFYVPFFWAKIFLKYKRYKSLFKKRRFSHAKLKQISSIPVAFLAILSILGIIFWHMNWLFLFVLFVIFFVLNDKFFLFLKKEKGFIFAAKAVIIAYLDTLVMGTGIIFGCIYYVLTDRNGKND